MEIWDGKSSLANIIYRERKNKDDVYFSEILLYII